MTDYAVFYLELYLLVHSRLPVLLSDDARCSRNPLVSFMSQLNDVVSQIFRDNESSLLEKVFRHGGTADLVRGSTVEVLGVHCCPLARTR